jgi:hypothetical protein
MNALINKNVMVLSKGEYIKATNDIYKTALEDGVRQGIAACLLCLNMHYNWKEKRLSRFAGGVQDILKLPSVLGKDIDGNTVVEYLRNEFGIDIDELEMEVKL